MIHFFNALFPASNIIWKLEDFKKQKLILLQLNVFLTDLQIDYGDTIYSQKK